MNYEQQTDALIKENTELKAQVNALMKCLKSESRGGIIKDMRLMSGRIEWYDKVKQVLDSTPEQCLIDVKISAFRDGFNESAEGWNAEHGLNAEGIEDIVKEYADKLRGGDG